MNNCGYQNQISAYLNGDLSLSPLEAKALEKHMNECGFCKAEAANARLISEALASMEEIDLPDGFHEAFMKRLAAEDAPNAVGGNKTKKIANKGIGFRQFAGMAAAALCGVIVLSGVVTGVFSLAGSGSLSTPEGMTSPPFARTSMEMGAEAASDLNAEARESQLYSAGTEVENVAGAGQTVMPTQTAPVAAEAPLPTGAAEQDIAPLSDEFTSFETQDTSKNSVTSATWTFADDLPEAEDTTPRMKTNEAGGPQSALLIASPDTVKVANITVTVEDADAAQEAIEGINGDTIYFYTENNGYVNVLNVQKSVESEYLTVAVDSVKALGEPSEVYVNEVSIVNEKNDTAVKLDNKRVEFGRLLNIMNRAETVDDMIAVEYRLSSVINDMDGYQTLVRQYEKNARYATLSITVFEDKASEITTPTKLPDRAKNSFLASVNMIILAFESIATFFSGAVLPLAIVGVAAAVVYSVMRGIRKRKTYFHNEQK